MYVSELKLFDVLRLKFKMNEADAKEIVQEAMKAEKAIDEKIEEEVERKIENLATKQNLADIKTELSRQIYFVGLIQFLAIVSSVIAIIAFMMK
jgi:polyhydroxyalkanoate synthesis regulator phasin